MTNTNAIDMTDADTRSKVVLVTIIAGLTIEIGTGMKVSRGVSPIEALKRDFGFTGRQKKPALKHAIAEMKKLDPTYEASARTLALLS